MDDRLDHFFAFFLIFCFCSNSKMYLSRLCIRRNRRICLLLDQILDFLCHLTFTDATDFHHTGINNLRLFLSQIWIYGFFKHWNHLIRRSRKQDRSFSFFLHDQSRSCSVVIIKNDRTFRNHGLFIVVLCNAALWMIFLIFFQICFHEFFGMKIFPKRKSHYLSCNFFCQVIFCRSKASGKDDHIRAIQSGFDHAFHSVRVVTNYRLVINCQTKFCTFL